MDALKAQLAAASAVQASAEALLEGARAEALEAETELAALEKDEAREEEANTRYWNRLRSEHAVCLTRSGCPPYPWVPSLLFL